MSDIKAGTYRGKVTASGFGESKNGNPFAFVQFTFDDGTDRRSLRWMGGLDSSKPVTKDGRTGLDLTVESLDNAGFNAQSIMGLNDAVENNHFDPDREVEIVVEKNASGYANIKYINKIGGLKFTGALNTAQVQSKIAPLQAAYEKARAKLNLSSPTVAAENLDF